MKSSDTKDQTDQHGAEDAGAAESPAPDQGAPEAAAPDRADEPVRETGLESVEPRAAAGETAAERELAELRARVASLEDQLLRRRAEFENYRRRAERERSQAGDDGAAAMLTELLPSLDDLERAIEAKGGEGVREGVQLIRRNLMSLLEGRGLAADDPQGEAFDPARHEAVVHEPAPGHEDGTIVEVFQKGYTFKDRLLRPAIVKVAKGEDSETSEDSGAGGESVH